MIRRLLCRLFHPAATRRVLEGSRLHAFDNGPREAR